jgi:ribose transport system permease protein
MTELRAEPAPPDAEHEDELHDRSGLGVRILTGSTTRVLLILVGLVVAFSITEPDAFATVDNLRNVVTNAAILLVISVGMTYVILTAGIDLSVGAVLVFAGVVSAKAMAAVGGDSWGVVLVGLAVALGCGLGWGTLNGLLITKARVPPLIVTLGTLGMALGFALIITGGVDQRDIPFTLVESVGVGRLFGEIPWLVVIAGAVALVFGVALSQTRFGRHTYAIGSSDEAARRAGINVDRHLIMVYGLAGLLAGLAGFMSLARFATTTIGGHSTDNLQAIAAVVLGGTSLFGGVGSVAGTVIGVFIPAVLANGFVIAGVETFWRDVAVGAVLILAVYLDQLRRRTQYRA